MSVAINQNICGSWSVQDVDAFEKLPYWLAKRDARYRKEKTVWPSLFPKAPWRPNMGDTMRVITVEEAPILRQTAYPTRLSAQPSVDVIDFGERANTSVLWRKRFTSPVMTFLPAFQDFITNKVAPTQKSLARTMMFYEEQFIRTWLWQFSPYVYVAGYGLLAADTPSSASAFAASAGKTSSWILNTLWPLLQASPDPYLSMSNLFKCHSMAKNEIGMIPYEGSELQEGMSTALGGKYVFVTQDPVWDAFTYDPWVLDNRVQNMDIVNDMFKGDIFGKIRGRIEDKGMRILITDGEDGDPLESGDTIEWPAPEKLEDDADDPNYKRRRPAPRYTTSAQIYISWLVGGGDSYKLLSVGGVPSPFNRDNGSGHPMDWNGRIYLNSNLLTKCTDSDDAEQWDTNSWNEYVRLQAQAVYGMIGLDHFNILPIVHRAPTLELPTA